MIYCVEDDAGIRDIEVYTLNSMGLPAQGCVDGTELFSALRDQAADLILLDLMLPGEDGLTILKKLRQNPVTRQTPVILATAKGAEYDRITGLDLGADDYLGGFHIPHQSGIFGAFHRRTFEYAAEIVPAHLPQRIERQRQEFRCRDKLVHTRRPGKTVMRTYLLAFVTPVDAFSELLSHFLIQSVPIFNRKASKAGAGV